MTPTAPTGTAWPERLLLQLDQWPLSTAYRVAIGASIAPIASAIAGATASAWWLLACLVVVLLSLRVGPAVARKAFPFSQAALQVWAARRKIAKRYDSYQWQKLFWIGIGLLGYTLAVDGVRTQRLVLGAVCLVAGAAGGLAWRSTTARAERGKWVARDERGLA